jgi:hypothetical protein
VKEEPASQRAPSISTCELRPSRVFTIPNTIGWLAVHF